MTSEPIGAFNTSLMQGEIVFPQDSTPSIAAHRIHNEKAYVASFIAPSWPLAALEVSNRPHRTIHFEGWPHGFQDFARQVAYVLINHGIPESLLEDGGSTAARWLGGASISNILLRLRAHVVWLTTDWSEDHPGTPVTCPADVDSQHLDDLRAWIDSNHVNGLVRSRNLLEVVRIWHLNPWLPEDCQWPEPEWRIHDWRPKRRREENKSKIISESTLGPLLEWSIAFVNSFAPDIIAAQSHYLGRMSTLSPTTGGMTASEWLDFYASSGRPLPARSLDAAGRQGERVAWHVMEYRHGIPRTSFANAYRGKRKLIPEVDQVVQQDALDMSVTAQFKGRSWLPYISVYDMNFAGGGKNLSHAGPLLSHLRTACLVVTAALTGMRPEEVLNLQYGCCEEPILRPGGSRLNLIRGDVYKGVRRSEDGSPGKPHPAVWATVSVASKAIHTMEQVNDLLGRGSGLLFSDRSSVTIYTRTAAGWIDSFIDFVNTRLAPHTVNPEAYTIPPDPDGRVTLKRFRRTLAWFLRHRPNGDVTTAIQYQHVGTSIGEGYAGTKASGMPDLLLEEDWHHRRDTIRHLGSLLADGSGISGPGAQRALQAVNHMPRHLLPADERRLRKDESLLVYENPAAIALCIYREKTALCQKLEQAGKDTQPDLLGCVDGCLNVARTDNHIEELHRRTKALRDQAELVPAPLAQSMLAQAARNEQIVARSVDTRLIRKEGSSIESENQSVAQEMEES